MVKSSSKNRVKKRSETHTEGCPDIRKFLTDTKSIHNTKLDNYPLGVEDVFDNYQDGAECINYPIFTDHGPFSFSLIDFDRYQEMCQDDLQDLVTTCWLVYKQEM